MQRPTKQRGQSRHGWLSRSRERRKRSRERRSHNRSNIKTSHTGKL
jgi:hypothetical protein